MTLKSRSNPPWGGGLTQDTRADILPTFSHVLPESTWRAEGSPLPSHLRFAAQKRLILHGSPQPRFSFLCNCDKSRKCAWRVC